MNLLGRSHHLDAEVSRMKYHEISIASIQFMGDRCGIKEAPKVILS